MQSVSVLEGNIEKWGGLNNTWGYHFFLKYIKKQEMGFL